MVLPVVGTTGNNDWPIWDTPLHSPLTTYFDIRAIPATSCGAHYPDHLRTPNRTDDRPNIPICTGRSIGRSSRHLLLMAYPRFRRTNKSRMNENESNKAFQAIGDKSPQPER